MSVTQFVNQLGGSFCTLVESVYLAVAARRCWPIFLDMCCLPGQPCFWPELPICHQPGLCRRLGPAGHCSPAACRSRTPAHMLTWHLICCLQAIAAQKRREAEQAEEMANNRVAALTAGQQAVQQHQTQSQAKMEEARGHALNAQQARSGSVDTPGHSGRTCSWHPLGCCTGAPLTVLECCLVLDRVGSRAWTLSHCNCLALFKASALLSPPTSEITCSKQPAFI